MKKIFILTITLLILSKSNFSLLAQNYSSSIISGINEIAGTGTPVTLTSTSSSSALPIGFTVNFYGIDYTNFYINPNGTLSFGSANQTYMTALVYSPNLIPSAQTPNNFIGFAFLAPRSTYGEPITYPSYASASINYFVSGNAPNRILVVNFKGVTYPGQRSLPAQTFNIQIQISEGSNGKIEVHNTNNSAQYNPNDQAYEFIQIGLENIDGSIGVAATPNNTWNLDNKTVRFTYCASTPNIPSNVTPSTVICNATSPQTVNLAASCASGTVAWYKTDGTTPLPSTTVSPTASTTYKVRCENNGCYSAFVSTDITVGTSNPTAPIVTLNPSYPVNAGTSISLTTNCYNNFVKWDDNTTTSPRIVTPNTTTAYSAKCVLNSCESPITNFSVSVIVPPPTLTASINPICSGTSTVLTAGNCTGTLTWNNSLGTGTSKTVSPTIGTNYLVTCSSTGLTANLTIGVITTLPTAPTSITKNPTTAVNPNTSVILTVVGCASGNTVKWNDNSTINPRTVTPAATTTYTAKCVNATCESATAASVTVDVNGPPVITTTINPICSGTSTVLTATNCSGTLSWYDGSNGSLGTGTTKTVVAVSSGTYSAYCSTSGLYGYLAITVNPTPTLSAITATPLNINTVGGSSTLSVTYSGGTLNWYENSDSQYLTGTGTLLGSASSITVSPTSEQNYEAICTLNGCSIRKNKRLSYGLTLSGAGDYDLNGVFNEGKGVLIDYVTIPNGVANLSYFTPSGGDANTYFYTKLYENDAYNYQTSFSIRKNNVWEIYSRSLNSSTPLGVDTKRYHTKFQYTTQRPPCKTIWVNEGSTEKNLTFSGVCEVQPSCPIITVTAASVLILGVENTLTVSGCNSPNTISWSDGLGNTPTVTIFPSAGITYTATCSASTCATSSASISNTAQLSISNGGSYNLGCFGFNQIGPQTGNFSICPQTNDVGTNYYSNGQTDSYTGFREANFVVRQNNTWVIQKVVPQATYSTLYHTKLKYDTYNPPCTAVWINDADGSEIILTMSGACQNVDNTVTSITTPASICAGQSMPVSFTTSTSAASYTVELLRDWTNTYTGGGPQGGSGTDLITSITSSSTTSSLPIPISFNYFGTTTPLPTSGCVTTSLGSGVNRIRCDNYRVRVKSIGSTQGVSQSLLQLNAAPTPIDILRTTQSGNWNTASTWQCGVVPTATNIVEIQAGHIININNDVHAKSIKLIGTGKINYTGTVGKLFLNQ